MKGLKNIVVIAAVCVMTILLSNSAVMGVAVRQISLAEMISSAELIFSGKCIGSEIRYAESLKRDICTFTFSVDKMIKGKPQKEISVNLSKMLVDLKHVPTYKIGQEVVLFLSGESRIGFSSPVGLGQGKFLVKHIQNARKSVVNENNNHNLFKGMNNPAYRSMLMKSCHHARIGSILNQRSGPVNYDMFLAVIETLLQQNESLGDKN